ncbi:heterokaryon incompatibility protein-domain-containing protein, partial [Paraphoma chrysanthemicola]
MKSYVYTPLAAASYMTRLLQILPGPDDSDIVCVLHEYLIPINNAFGPYECLSYVWGDSTQRRRIYIQDDSSSAEHVNELLYLDVTSNLFIALHRLRNESFPRLMWIDAICINQADLRERATQVQYMSTIYSSAGRVLVWLGEEADDSTRLFAAIEAVAMESRRVQTARTKRVPRQPLVALLKRPWFHRVWILQEMAAARQLVVICGEAKLTGSTFVQGLASAKNWTDPFLRHLGTTVLYMMSWDVPSIVPTTLSPTALVAASPTRLGILPLGLLLEKFHLHEASDRRDKIFALLGMCEDEELAGTVLKPDYTQPWSSVFKSAIQYLLGTDCSIYTWDDQEQAVIIGYGWSLGRVGAISETSEIVRVTSWHFSGPRDWGNTWNVSWQNQTYCKSLAEGDVLWLMSGAKHPCIIRHCVDHFDVIAISVPLTTIFLNREGEETPLSWGLLHSAMINGQGRPVSLVWDW